MIDDKLDSLSLTLARDMIERCRTEMLKVSDPLALKGVALQNFIDTIFLLASRHWSMALPILKDAAWPPILFTMPMLR